MAKAKPCRRCGHGKGQHTKQSDGRPKRCKYRYAARDGHNLDTGIDGVDEHGHWKNDENGFGPRRYQCLCPEWLPEDKYEIVEDGPYETRPKFIGYEDGLTADGKGKVLPDGVTLEGQG